MVAYGRERVAEGWNFLRYGVGEGSDPERDGIYEQSNALEWSTDAFAALRDAVGPDTEICVDFHQRTTPAYAIQLARELKPIRPFFVEDPVAGRKRIAVRVSPAAYGRSDRNR